MSRTLTVLALAGAGIAVLGALAGGAGATYPGSNNGRLAFGVRVGDNMDIYSAQPNGAGLRRLTTGSAFDACASWSPDGKTIAYCSDASGSFEIWTMRQNGAQKRQVTELDSFSIFPDVSPNGAIAFGECSGEVAELPNTCRLEVVDSTTGDVSVLVDLPGTNEEYPVWSPDGTRIAFLRNQVDGAGEPIAGSSQVYVANADGSNPTALTDDQLIKDQAPDWHPGGGLIAYEAGGEIWTVDLGGATDRITDTGGAVGGPTWSPDGTQIAYRNFADYASPKIEIMNADGTGAHALIPEFGGTQAVPGWQPRGRR